MEVDLNITGHTVQLADYVSQDVLEAMDNIMLSTLPVADNSWRRVTIDQIANALGTEVTDKINAAKDEDEREKLMEKAKKEVAATDPKKGGASLADLKRAIRIKTTKMITGVELNNGDDMDITNFDKLTKWVLALPYTDYKQLEDAVGEIEAQMEANLKG